MRIAYLFAPSGHNVSYKLQRMILPQLERGLATGQPGDATPAGAVEGVTVGCFPDLYNALAASPPDQVISL